MSSWGVDVDLMLHHHRTTKSIAAVQLPLGGHSLAEKYREIKQIEECLVAFISQTRAATTTQKEDVAISQYYQAVSAAVYAAKYIKDISQNIEDFHDEDSRWSGKVYLELRLLLIQLYKTASQIIDGVRDDILIDQMMGSVDHMKRDDQNFVHALSKQLSKEPVDDLELSDILHLHHYVYLSSVSFVEAVNLLLLKITVDSE